MGHADDDHHEHRDDELDHEPVAAEPVEVSAPTAPSAEVSAPTERAPQSTPETARPEQPLSFEFTGNAREYFRIWIVNTCLTLFTLGIFSAWAKVRKKRYLYSHTQLDGTPFQYLGARCRF